MELVTERDVGVPRGHGRGFRQRLSESSLHYIVRRARIPYFLFFFFRQISSEVSHQRAHGTSGPEYECSSVGRSGCGGGLPDEGAYEALYRGFA